MFPRLFAFVLLVAALLAGCNRPAPPADPKEDGKGAERVAADIPAIGIKPTIEPQPMEAEIKLVPLKPGYVFALSAQEFFDEVQKSRAEAATKYGPALIEIEGVVKEASALHTVHYFKLEAGPENAAVICSLIDDKEPWVEVPRGRKIKLKGRFLESAGQPSLTKCQVVEVGASLTVEMTAEKLAAAYAKDPAGTKKTLDRKLMTLTGVIVATKNNDLDSLTCFLKGTGDVRVRCGFKSVDKADVEALEPGNRVRLVGEFQASDSGAGPVLGSCRRIPVK